MALFNRALAAIVGLALLALAVALLVAPQTTLAGAHTWLTTLRALPTPSLLWLAAGVLAVAVVLTLVELWPRRPQRTLTVRFDGGCVLYPPEAIGKAIEHDLATIDGLRETQAVVVGRGGRVDVQLRLVVEREHDPHGAALQAAGRVRDRIERQLGLRLHDLRLSVVPSELALLDEQRPAPTAA